MNSNDQSCDVELNPCTQFLFSTSGSQSSIAKHNRALKTLGINLVYFTFKRDITPDIYASLLRAPIVRGGAITGQGLKSGIISHLDKVDNLAKKIGAVNTVLNDNSKLFGFNTDAFGFETAVRHHIDYSGLEVKKAAIYGNGGVSGVAAYVLKKLGVEVTMIGRNPDNVAQKMKTLGLSPISGPYDLVVNATPVSSEPLKQAVGLLGTLSGCKMVFDHNMPEKDGKRNYLEEWCTDQNVYFAPGKDMYVPQMIKQWRLFLDGYNNSDGKRLKISESDIKRAWRI